MASTPPPVPARQDPVCRRRVLLRRLTMALDAPMAALSLVFFGLVVADLAGPEDWAYRPYLDDAAQAIWAVFLVEFVVRLAIAPRRRLFLRRRWFDLLVLIVPMFRVLRVLRLFRSSLSLFRLASATRRGSRALERFLRQSRFGYVVALTSAVVFAAAAGMLLLERHAPGSQIRSFGDALWWSAAIVTTVGSDKQPVTGAGRGLAVGMMIFGMAVFGYLVSHAAAWLQRGDTPASPRTRTAPGAAPPARGAQGDM